MKIKVSVFAILFVLITHSAFAASVWEMAQSDRYGRKMGGMLGRGVINVATCFVDLIVHTVDGTKQGPPFVGTMTGLGSGLGCSALRVTSGALDVLTFWVPNFNGIPVGRSYSDCTESVVTSASEGNTNSNGYYVDNNAVQAAPQAEEARHAVAPQHDAMDYIKK